MKKIVFVTKKLSFKEIALLEPYFEVISLNSYNELFNHPKFSTAFALLSFVTDPITSTEINNFPTSLKVISNCAVGYNNISINTCQEKNIIVTNTPGVLTNATADLTFALLLALSRRLLEGHKMIIENNFHGWEPDMLLGTELSGKTLGIIGLGRIGLAVAKRAKAFGMDIIYYNRNIRSAELDEKENIYYQPFEELLKSADFISIHTSLNDYSKHLITEKELKLMKKTSFIINTSRGECIKEFDLVEALKNKEIAGAALDVFEFEPKITEALKFFDNVILTPHIGSATFETRGKMVEIACQNLINVALDKEPISRVV